MAKNWKWYVDNNDLMGCYERFKKAYSNWKDHWWETIEMIFNQSSEWAKDYILDTLNREIVPLVKKVKKKIETTLKNGSNTYLIKMFDENGNHIFTKIGKADNVKTRLRQQMGHTYKDGTTVKDYEIIKTYHVPTDDLALVLESFMRNYFKKLYDFIPNDRFFAFTPTDKDMEVFENYYNLVVENA